MATIKGFVKNWKGDTLLPITRGELVLDSKGYIALFSDEFIATDEHAGLMTSAEKAMLNGTSGGQSLTDIYAKLNHINTGLTIGSTHITFYNSETGKATPISIVSPTEGQLNLATNSNQEIAISLKKLTDTETSVSAILRSIIVDKYGRVTAVSGSALSNADIPETLSGKKLENCETSATTIPDSDKAVVNKKYVDDKIATVSGIATGALKFGGALSSWESASAKLADVNNDNSYYKVTGNFEIASSYLYNETEGSVSKVYANVGDTLIIKSSKFIYVPSGDDITTITIEESGAASPVVNKQIGDISLVFGEIFNVSGSGTSATINLPEASGTSDGYLKASDWNRFNSYASQSGIYYESEIEQSFPGAYLLGTLDINGSENKIYGINNVSTLTLENGVGTNTSYNPILKFTETGVTSSYDITLEGTRGIQIKKNGNTVQFTVVNTVAANSEKYLNINDKGEFEVIIGSTVDQTINDGLVDYSEFVEFENTVVQKFESLYFNIENSLTDTTQTYYYGSTALKNAVNPTGFVI